MHPNQDPDTKIVTSSGPNVISIRFTPEYPEHTESAGATRASIQVLPHYTCDVTFKGNVITVVQNIAFRLWLKLDLIGKTVMVVDKYLSDEYTLSVDQSGQLQMTLTKTTPEDRSGDTDSLNWFENTFSGDINGCMSQLKSSTHMLDYGRHKEAVEVLEQILGIQRENLNETDPNRLAF